jgi:hypothetical protein
MVLIIINIRCLESVSSAFGDVGGTEGYHINIQGYSDAGDRPYFEADYKLSGNDSATRFMASIGVDFDLGRYRRNSGRFPVVIINRIVIESWFICAAEGSMRGED